MKGLKGIQKVTLEGNPIPQIDITVWSSYEGESYSLNLSKKSFIRQLGFELLAIPMLRVLDISDNGVFIYHITFWCSYSNVHFYDL